jgi:4-alpha-glucanotransferase
VAHDSCDVWANREQFLLDKDNFPSSVAGVPPDYFCEDGQLWGNPLYDWEQMRKDGYRWWSDRIEYMLTLFDGVRIDHFRAFQDFYAVKPTEKTAKNGKWIKGPRTSLINKFKKVKGDFLIIAEDLGVITNEVKLLVEKSGFPGMRVLQFGFLGDENSPHLPHNYIQNSVAYTGTHDNNTLLGYMWENSNDVKNLITDYFGVERHKWNESYDQIIRQMLSSSAGLTIFPIQDLLKYGADTRLNTPGVASNNWAFRITKTAIDGIDTSNLNRINKLYGRK